MSGSYLLDTSVVIDLLGGDPQTGDAFDRAADVVLPAIALKRGYTLVTRDGHFAAVDGLRSESWCEA